ncbi:MAG: Fur family transcriptional regulator [Vicinamibacteria bacterium]
MSFDEAAVLKDRGIHPSAQRMAVARYVLSTGDHPSADEVWSRVRKRFPTLSRATVYNTLNLFVARGILRQLVLTGGRVVFDPNVANHHHFIDIDTGRIHDIPWESLRVSDVSTLKDFDVNEYQVVMRGRKAKKENQRARPAAEPRGAARR